MEQISLPSITEIEILEELDRLSVSFGAFGSGESMEIFSWNPIRPLSSLNRSPQSQTVVGKSLRIWDEGGSLGHITVPESSEQLYTSEGRRLFHEIKDCLSRLQFENQRTNQRRFVNGLLHDLKGPLRRVGSIVSFLSGPNELPPELNGCLEREMQSAEWVLGQAGIVASALHPWSEERCDPQHAWNEATYRIEHLYPQFPVVLHFESDYSGFAPLSEHSLSDLFVQLIHNSLKFGGSPCQVSVTLKAGTFVERGEAETGLKIEYHDNGSSLDPQYFHKLFQPFYRGHAPSFPGAGLGLFACRQIARRARGYMEARQDPQSRALHLTLWFPSA